jgi:hypothetical protein
MAMPRDHQPLVQMRPMRLQDIFAVLQPPEEGEDP